MNVGRDEVKAIAVRFAIFESVAPVVRMASLALIAALGACDRHSTPEQSVDSASPQIVDAARAEVALEEPTLVSFPSGKLTLHGFMWRPHGLGRFPAIVYNHGSESLPGPKPDQAQFFVSHGFVLFVPHRRGQGRSQDAGAYIADYDASTFDPAKLTRDLVTQTDDVMAAVAYAGTLPYVDAKHVAVVGCSFGGIEALFAAERGTGIVAAIDFAGASMTWANAPPLRDRMKLAAKNAKVPVLFIQAQNDFDTTPSLVLSSEMQDAGKPARAKIFPPNGTSAEDGHHFCAGGDAPAWGKDVLDFLRAPMSSGGRAAE